MKKAILRILTVSLLACLGAFALAACGESEEPAPEERTYRVVYADGVEDAVIAVPTDPTQYKAGDTVTVLGGAERTHFTFTGWSEGSAHYEEGDTFTMPARNVLLTAGWTANIYNITFSAGDAEGATGLPAAAEAAAGAYALPEEEPQLTGKRFLGWKVENDDTLYKHGGEHASYEVAGSTEFVAQWEQLYLLSYADGVEDAAIDVPVAEYYAAGETVTVTGIDRDIRSGYYFAGWQKDTEIYLDGETFEMPSDGVTLTPVWLSADIDGMWTGSDENYSYEFTVAKGSVDGEPDAIGHFLYKQTYTELNSTMYFIYPITVGRGTLITRGSFPADNTAFEIDGSGLTYHSGDDGVRCPDRAALPAAPSGLNGTWHGTIGEQEAESELTIGDTLSFSCPVYQNGDPMNKIEFTGYEHITIGKYYIIYIETNVAVTQTLIVTKSGSSIEVYFQSEVGTFTPGNATVMSRVTFELNDVYLQTRTRYVAQGAEIGELPAVYLYETWSTWLFPPENDDYFMLASTYAFDGWFVAGQDEAIDEHYRVTGDITVTAKLHIEIDYSRAPTVTFYDSATDPDESIVIEKDASHFSFASNEWTLTSIPACTFTNGEKEFKGWMYFGIAPDDFSDHPSLVPMLLTGEGAPNTVGGSVNLTLDVVTDVWDVPTSYAFYALWEGDVLEDLTPPRDPYAVGYWQTSVMDRSQTAFFYVEALGDGTLYGVLIYGREGEARSLAGELTMTEAEGTESYTFCGKQFTLTENTSAIQLTVNFGGEDISLTFSRGSYRNDNMIYGEYAYFDDVSAWDPKYIINFDPEGSTAVNDSYGDGVDAEVKWLAGGSIGIISVDEDPTLAENIVNYVVFSWSGMEDFPTVFYMITGSSSYELQGSEW